MVKAKLRNVSPPQIKSASEANMVVNPVNIVRDKISLILLFYYFVFVFLLVMELYL